MTVRPYFASEKLLAGPPFKGCRVSTLWHGFACATNNESALRADARVKGVEGIRDDLQRGWRAFATATPADSNGIPDQGDVLRICEAMFPDLPKPEVRSFGSFEMVTDALKDGKAVSIALRLSVLPPSSPVHGDAGNADHQVLLYGHQGDKVRMIDPMHAQSVAQTYSGRWVPAADVRKAGAAFGQFFVELFPIGGWTQEALARRQLRETRADLTAANAKAARLTAKVADLQEELALCQGGQDCDKEVEAALTAQLDSLRDWIAGQEAA